MKKSRKKYHPKTKSLYSTSFFRLLIVTTLTAIVILIGKNTNLNAQSNVNVLGSNTFIADKSTEGNTQTPPPPDQPGENSNRPPETQNQNRQTQPPVNVSSVGKINFQSEKGHTEINLENQNSKIEISSEDGRLSIKAKKPNGTEIQLQEDSLSKINEALKNEDVEIATSAGSGFLLRKGQFEAETHFPLSINPNTNTLTVTTPAGEKDVTVLPDQAVNNLIDQKQIDRVSSSSASTGIILGLFNNNPAFQISGSDSKKLLGFIPVNIDKTSVVSAQTGSILQTNESIINKILDLLSVQ